MPHTTATTLLLGDDGADAAPSLADQAYNCLRRRIITCELRPGTTVAARTLQQDLGLGASPVRDALVRLTAEGLVITLPRSGYRIMPVTLASMEELFDAWRLIEPMIARRAAERISPGELQRLRVLVESSAVEDGGAADIALAGLENAQAQWEIISRAARNEHLWHMYCRLGAQQVRLWYLMGMHEKSLRLPIARGDSLALYRALEQRAADQAEKLVLDFIDRSRQVILRAATRLPSLMAAEITAS
ncbi:GntR family transcriptional regulator [Streptomyces sp. NPDC088747]|uniref:GntR family transcriptional regulator n=1 Tax=Streptomyces sp. NPDC088747 TaxID=3365886 RepID=UPI0037F82703